ncbi:MAG: hypothetical protein K2X82_20210 [Gemmataceae bacterium]|nr:hypothetical protein [Gemmataceae bacterium]
MSEIVTQPWPYLVLLAAVVSGRRLRLWGWGFGVEVNSGPKPRAAKGRRPKRRKR